MTEKLYAPIHSGEILMEDFIVGLGTTQNKLAVAIGVPPGRINEIVHGKRSITADTALRLAKYFGVDPQFWLRDCADRREVCVSCTRRVVTD